ncbi:MULTISPECIES: restriction endonuclease subunit S [unclassified Empedobacter]|uniref:restriction endonuclease subunit S n=1 Tax=unclassified Empedobacter TaxID=2643773 RepID=UPI0025B9867E|nr:MULTISPECIES: restriction endonuclease subunit S [unclassified Empedobacter]
MNNWKQISVGDFVEFNPSESIKKGSISRKIGMDKLGTFQRKINGYEYSQYTAGPKFRNGDTVVAKITPCLENGKTAYVDILDDDELAFGSSEFIVLRENEYSDKKFIYYLARSPWFRERAISCMEGTSGRKRVNEGALKRQEILVPSTKKEQQKIAAVLSALDDKIEVNNKINAELEAMAKTLYDYWFVQFEFPITNESHPELVSGSHPKGYKSSGGKMVYNSTLKREIPEGWEVKFVDDLLRKNESNLKLNAKEYSSEGKFPIVDQSTDFIAGFSDKVDYKIDISVDFPAIVFGDHTRILKLINFDFIRGADGTQVLFSNNERLPQILFYHSLLKIDLSNYGYARHFKFLKDSMIILPHLDLANKFERKANIFYKKILNNQKQNQELAQLRDWLLPMLMNGQVKVEDAADEFLGMVAEPFVDYQINNLTDKDKKIRRKMLATYIINQSLDDTSFGKTKFEKLLHLVESHIVKGDYNQKYSVQAAGPYDGGFTKVFWNEVTKSKWFEIKEFGKLKRIVAGENHIKSQKDYGYLSDELKELINNFISKFKNSNYERPEIVSTLFAVWNNRIIRNEMITDALLKKDFLEWDEQKARYENRLDDALAWMRNNNVIPTGWGNEIKRVKK